MKRNVATIPADVPFLRALAQGIADQAGGFTPALAKTLILLPTRRAARGLRDTFLQLSGGKPLLLPRMQPLGDVDQDELDLRLAGLHDDADIAAIPPAISSLQRLMLLARLIRARSPETSSEQALKLAGSLATLIDQVHTEDLDFSRLATLVPDDLSAHWQQTLSFLSIVTEHWPQILADLGQIDPADRRNRLMKTLAASWRRYPPDHPVIAAGSTGSIPATALLLDVISTLPQGCVVLPGLDRDLDQDSWDALSDTHPQAVLKSLLARMETDRHEVRTWQAAEGQTASPRLVLGREMMRPPETVQEWARLENRIPELQRGLEGFELVEAATPSEEAYAIAVVMRAVLEEPGRTAALVTPDRALARRVCTALQKWQIPVDDSAGSSLSLTQAGHLLLLALACVLENFNPAVVLNLLKHQSVSFADAADVARFELKLCRGPRPPQGLVSLHKRLLALKEPEPALDALLTRLEDLFAPLLALTQSGTQEAGAYIRELVRIVDAIAPGTAWQGEDGEAASLLLAELHEQHHLLPPSDLSGFDGALRQLMAGIQVRHPVLHPRLVILGQLEARMIHADVMICGSLNEGSWPAEPAHDPWMSRPMRKTFGLPSPEFRTGIAAHDFIQALCAPRVIVTRSLKSEGAPTVPSRWLQRLETVLSATGLKRPVNASYLAWARALQVHDGPASPASKPAPCPPVSYRPDRLSATWIERWNRNPYHLYVAKILKLSPLTPLDQDTTAAERGSLVHAILKDFLEKFPDHLPPSAGDDFIRLARARMDSLETDPAQREYWWPRLERLADWVVARERVWRETAQPWKQEHQGEIKIPFARGHFTLFARADRIDRLKSGGVAIIDYKTGQIPTALNSGEDSQLPLEGLILRHGGFDPDLREAGLFSFWKLLGSREAGEVKDFDATQEMIDLAEDGLRTLLAVYEDPQTPYTAKAPRNPRRMYDDEKAIAHLARLAEWSSLDGGDGDDA